MILDNGGDIIHSSWMIIDGIEARVWKNLFELCEHVDYFSWMSVVIWNGSNFFVIFFPMGETNFWYTI